jgi:hypothetical protein
LLPAFRAIASTISGAWHNSRIREFSALNGAIAAELKAQFAVLDGEIVFLDDGGRTQFRDLLFHRGEPRFIAFDLLCARTRICATCHCVIVSSD